MSRRKSPRSIGTKPPLPHVNQPTATSSRVASGKADLLVNEVVRNPDVLQRLMHTPEMAGVMMQVSHTRSGPLPDPEELSRYEKVSPGFAREILEMAKSEQSHRHTQNKKSLSGAIWKDRIGQIFALVCVFVFAYIATIMISNGAYGYATTLLGVELVALTGVFLAGRKDKNPETKKPQSKK